MNPENPRERRRYRRIQAPVFCRPARLQIMHQAIDVSMGGVRVYSDMEVEKGEQLKLELFLPDGVTIGFTGKVVWLERLPAGSPARFDVGLMFLDVTAEARRLLMTVLAPLDADD